MCARARCCACASAESQRLPIMRKGGCLRGLFVLLRLLKPLEIRQISTQTQTQTHLRYSKHHSALQPTTISSAKRQVKISSMISKANASDELFSGRSWASTIETTNEKRMMPSRCNLSYVGRSTAVDFSNSRCLQRLSMLTSAALQSVAARRQNAQCQPADRDADLQHGSR